MLPVCLFSNRSQMTWKCGKNKKVAQEAIAESVTEVFIQIIGPVDKTKLSCRPYHTRVDHYMLVVIYRSPDGLPANEKEEINNILS